MSLHRLAAGCCLALVVSITAPAAQAQDFPNRPVKIITDSAPGSAVDVILRVIADRLTAIWGQQVLPVNQPGAGGAIAARLAAGSPPDGYTLFIPALSTFVAPPGAAANLPIEIPRDFAPVGFLGGAPMFISAAPWLGVSTLPDLIALAKRRPGELVYGALTAAAGSHISPASCSPAAPASSCSWFPIRAAPPRCSAMSWADACRW